VFPANRRKQSDRRYGTQRWRKLAKRIVKRYGWCYAEGCQLPASCADHIWPVTDETTDWEFFDPSGLRGACWAHNRIRSWTIGDAYRDGPRGQVGGTLAFPQRRKPRIG